ncbi:hypothetical protein [Pseudomonas purpurea]|uniref:hypothetical protein n=1 Tax=Pseudomonas purpurea TaxID=3136737 RepID=UPI003262D8A3
MITLPDELRFYLMVVADSILFGGLAFLSLLLIVSGLSRTLRESWLHRGLTFMVLATLIAMELVGSWYANVSPA